MGINKERCTKEYREFISFAGKHAVLKECKSMQELAEKVLSNDSTRELFPLMAQLMVHALVLSISTTNCERCFSAMNQLKTDLSNKKENNNIR